MASASLLLGLLFCICSQVTYGILVVPDANFPCARGLNDLIPALPPGRFPPVIPSGVNVCDAICSNLSTCTYNWVDSLQQVIPMLLFRCYCHGQVPPPRSMLFSDYLKINCDEVTVNPAPSRCTCPPKKRSYKCIFNLIPPEDINSYICACW